jgi:hypothetical protein
MADLFQEILVAFDRLGLWKDGVELIGSWSFLLYQRHLGVRSLPLRTQDIDFLLPRPYPERQAVDLVGALSELGFHSAQSPTGSIYFIHPELRLEFLTPEFGRGENVGRSVKPLGIKAIQLRFLEMLLRDPIVVKEASVSVRVPNPKNFCLHKLIIAQRRPKKNSAKREKDIEQALYTLEILDHNKFKSAMDILPAKWKALILESLRQAWELFPLQHPLLQKLDLTPQK